MPTIISRTNHPNELRIFEEGEGGESQMGVTVYVSPNEHGEGHTVHLGYGIQEGITVGQERHGELITSGHGISFQWVSNEDLQGYC